MTEPVKMDPHDRALVLGITGSGKTHWVREAIVKPAPRVLAWDPHEEYGLETVSYQELVDSPDMLDGHNLRLSVVADYQDLDDLGEQFRGFSQLCRTVTDAVLVIDEVAILKGRAMLGVEYLATQSRHWQVPLVLVAQRAVSIPMTAREQCSKIFSFRQSSPDDIEALRERIGAKADTIKKLPRYKFVAWDEAEAFEGESSNVQE